MLSKSTPVTTLQMRASPVLSFSVSEYHTHRGKLLERLILPSTTRESGTILLLQNGRAGTEIPACTVAF